MSVKNLQETCAEIAEMSGSISTELSQTRRQQELLSDFLVSTLYGNGSVSILDNATSGATPTAMPIGSFTPTLLDLLTLVIDAAFTLRQCNTAAEQGLELNRRTIECQMLIIVRLHYPSHLFLRLIHVWRKHSVDFKGIRG